MLREKLIESHQAKRGEFRWRSREVSRIEGFSDAVFGFALTLLIVALEVPRTSGELLEVMRGFLAFGVTFAILFSVWYKQFTFFRNYGLEDRPTIVLTGGLLFVILFFVFPLKFVIDVVVHQLLGLGPKVRLPDGTLEKMVRPEHWDPMLAIYGAGFMAVFGLMALLYLHAWRQRGELGLDALERFDTLQALRVMTFGAAMGFATVTLAGALQLGKGKPNEDTIAIGAFIPYMLLLIAMLRFRVRRRKRRRELLETLDENRELVVGVEPEGRV